MFDRSVSFVYLLFALLFGLSIYPSLMVTIPVIQMKYFPVVANTHITELVENEFMGYTIFSGQADKVRDCGYDHVEWFIGHPDDPNKTRVDLIIDEGTTVRTVGGFKFGPWKVRLTPSQLIYNSFAIVYHDCSGWMNKSIFYPNAESVDVKVLGVDDIAAP